MAGTPPKIEQVGETGVPVVITETAAPGQLVYTCMARDRVWDEVTLEAINLDQTDPPVAHTLYLDVAGVVVPIKLAGLAGPRPGLSRWRLRNAGRDATEIRAWADVTGMVAVKPEPSQEVEEAPA